MRPYSLLELAQLNKSTAVNRRQETRDALSPYLAAKYAPVVHGRNVYCPILPPDAYFSGCADAEPTMLELIRTRKMPSVVQQRKLAGTGAMFSALRIPLGSVALDTEGQATDERQFGVIRCEAFVFKTKVSKQAEVAVYRLHRAGLDDGRYLTTYMVPRDIAKGFSEPRIAELMKTVLAYEHQRGRRLIQARLRNANPTKLDGDFDWVSSNVTVPLNPVVCVKDRAATTGNLAVQFQFSLTKPNSYPRNAGPIVRCTDAASFTFIVLVRDHLHGESQLLQAFHV